MSNNQQPQQYYNQPGVASAQPNINPVPQVQQRPPQPAPNAASGNFVQNTVIPTAPVTGGNSSAISKKSATSFTLARKIFIFTKQLGIMTVIVLIAIASILGIKVLSNLNSQMSMPILDAFGSDTYNIVFLQNNLFYFCKIEDLNSEYIKCNDPYYLVRKKETGTDGKSEEKIYVTKPSKEEVYQPEGAFYILKSNIVYIAEIGKDSQVYSFINQNE